MVQLLLAVIYLAFISLGLPDGLLGCAWPTIHVEWGLPVSWAGIISFIICAGTVVSSLLSDRLTRALGAGKVTFISVAITALALWGFSVSGSFWALCLWAIPYGLGAGSVDAALNNYVALHYSSRHMSWLHCMWGVGASVGPYIMGAILTAGGQWPAGYRTMAIIQVAVTALLLLSLPLWKGRSVEEQQASPALSLRQVLAIPGAKDIFLAFFCYCGMESMAMLWSASYLVLHMGVDEASAARYGSLFYLGMTVGRALGGFITSRFHDRTMIRAGQAVAAVGALAILLSPAVPVTLAGICIFGLGCAPIYPAIIHATPIYFGPERSQALIGVQMASAYIGSSLVPPLFGLVADYITPALFPAGLLVFLAAMVLLHERLLRRVKAA